MTGFRQILCASDFSKTSGRALALAIDVAKANHHARLVILHVFVPIVPVVPGRYIDVSTWSRVDTETRRWVERQLARLADRARKAGVSASALATLMGAANKYVANDSTVGDGSNTGGFRFNATTPTKDDTYISKFDFVLSKRQTIFFRGNYQDDLVGGAPQFPDSPAPSQWYHPKGFAVGHNWSISNHLNNAFVYGLTRLSVSTLGDSSVNQVSFRNVFAPAPTRTAT
jgi:hypothetical protein